VRYLLLFCVILALVGGGSMVTALVDEMEAYARLRAEAARSEARVRRQLEGGAHAVPHG
jgi:hypothetical protein